MLQLPQSDNFAVPLVGFIGRLDPQKGPDLILDALSGIIAMDCQVRQPVLFMGQPVYVRAVKSHMPPRKLFSFVICKKASGSKYPQFFLCTVVN